MYLSTHTHTLTHMTESLYCILETNMILQIYYNNKIFKKKKIRISRLKMKSLQKWEELRIPVSWKRYSLDTFTIQQENEAELTASIWDFGLFFLFFKKKATEAFPQMKSSKLPQNFNM